MENGECEKIREEKNRESCVKERGRKKKSGRDNERGSLERVQINLIIDLLSGLSFEKKKKRHMSLNPISNWVKVN